MNILFWMDAPESINIEKDTTYIFIHACMQRGWNAFYASKSSVSINDGNLCVQAFQFQSFSIGDTLSYQSDPKSLSQRDIDACFIRCDPPVDADYVAQMQMFSQFDDAIFFINHPLGILRSNEKLCATPFTNWIPKTLVSKNCDDLIQFAASFDRVVLKPMDGFGGQGIENLKGDDPELKKYILKITKNGVNYAILQQAVDHTRGDKRILLLDGEPIGAVLRKSENSHLNNFMAGGKPYQAVVNEHDTKIINAIQPFLKKYGLFFVGIDIVDDYLIEINVTSPTCLQEINRLSNQHLQKEVMIFLAQQISSRLGDDNV